MRAIAIVLFALIAIGCSDDDRRPSSVHVTVERLEKKSGFRVTWRLPQPARALIFHRSGAGRESQWHSRTEGTSFVKKYGVDVLESKIPRRDFIVDIDEVFVETAGNYPVMIPFSDGGVVLFTDHLRVNWLNCLIECSEKEILERSLVATAAMTKFYARPGEFVIVNDRVSNRVISTPPSTSGAIVYFGPQEPMHGFGFSFIADKNLPVWVRKELRGTFSRLIQLYTQRLGIPLPSRPLVFIPYLAGPRRAQASFSGSVLDSKVVLGLFGDRWKAPDTEARVDFARLMAHESFHLWNASLFRSVATPGGDWLHEGSADAFASLALLELGLIDRLTFLEMHREALNRCALGLSSGSLTDPPKPWTVRVAYDCGSIMQLLMDRALRDQGENLWKFWVSLFSKASSSSGYYTRDDFFVLADSLIGATYGTLVEQMKVLGGGQLRGSFDDPQTLEVFFSRIYDAAGIGITINEQRWPTWYSRLVAEKALTIAVHDDCRDSGNGYWMAKGNGARLIGSPRCRSIRGEVEIENIGEFFIWTDGVRVYDHIHQECKKTDRILIFTSGGRLKSLSCPRLPARPRFLEPRAIEKL